jgi:hypothetical protein
MVIQKEQNMTKEQEITATSMMLISRSITGMTCPDRRRIK